MCSISTINSFILFFKRYILGSSNFIKTESLPRNTSMLGHMVWCLGPVISFYPYPTVLKVKQQTPMGSLENPEMLSVRIRNQTCILDIWALFPNSNNSLVQNHIYLCRNWLIPDAAIFGTPPYTIATGIIHSIEIPTWLHGLGSCLS